MVGLVAGVAAGLALALARSPSRPPARRLQVALPARATPSAAPGGQAAARRHGLAVAAVLAAILGLFAGAPLPLVAAGPGAVLADAWVRRRRAARLVRARTAAITDVAFALAAELRAGHPPRAALAAAAAASTVLREPLTAAAAAVGSGATTLDELRLLARVPGCTGLTAVAAAWAVTEQAGGPVADVLDRLAAALDADCANAAALDATLAGPRATMLLLAALPVVGVALGESIGAHPTRLLLHHPLGWALLAGAALLDLLGVGWIRALSRGALRA